MKFILIVVQGAIMVVLLFYRFEFTYEVSKSQRKQQFQHFYIKKEIRIIISFFFHFHILVQLPSHPLYVFLLYFHLKLFLHHLLKLCLFLIISHLHPCVLYFQKFRNFLAAPLTVSFESIIYCARFIARSSIDVTSFIKKTSIRIHLFNNIRIKA